MSGLLRKRDFYHLVEKYQPLQFEIINLPWMPFTRKMNYAIRSRYRYYRVFSYILKEFNLNNSIFLDLGPYPGTFLRLLHILHPSKKTSTLWCGIVCFKFVCISNEEEMWRLYFGGKPRPKQSRLNEP